MVARALGAIHRLSAVRQGRCCLARDLTLKDVIGVRDAKRGQLLRGGQRPRELDHPVELGFARDAPLHLRNSCGVLSTVSEGIYRLGCQRGWRIAAISGGVAITIDIGRCRIRAGPILRRA
jgi:hypothetical protein